MKPVKGVLLIMLCLAVFGGCGKAAKETVTNRRIPTEDVTEFYYTVENVNYNAFYRRYRFYKQDGRYMFFHETRERPDGYGPAGQEDVTGGGDFELTAQEWQDFLAYLKDGTVSARKDGGDSGGSGPWTFIYWNNDKGKYRAFEFSSYDERVRFEEFCASLAETGLYRR